MKIRKTTLDEVLIIEPDLFPDNRGMFFESYSKRKYAELGITDEFVQDNHSISTRGVLRGLHFQINPGQAKLVRVTRGEVFDVAVDVRKDSPNFGKWVGIHLSEENHLQAYIPNGFAHGLCVLSETAEFLYKCSDYYSPENERGALWNDPDIGIDWPIENPILSDKDRKNPRLRDL